MWTGNFKEESGIIYQQTVDIFGGISWPYPTYEWVESIQDELVFRFKREFPSDYTDYPELNERQLSAEEYSRIWKSLMETLWKNKN